MEPISIQIPLTNWMRRGILFSITRDYFSIMLYLFCDLWLSMFEQAPTIEIMSSGVKVLHCHGNNILHHSRSLACYFLWQGYIFMLPSLKEVNQKWNVIANVAFGGKKLHILSGTELSWKGFLCNFIQPSSRCLWWIMYDAFMNSSTLNYALSSRTLLELCIDPIHNVSTCPFGIQTLNIENSSDPKNHMLTLA